MTRHRATQRARLALHPTRAAILATVHDEPGILLSQVRRSLRRSPGTIQHHVRLLEAAHFIHCVRTRRRCKIYPAETPVAEQRMVHRLHLAKLLDAPEGPARGGRTTVPGRDDLVALHPPMLHELADHLSTDAGSR